MLTVGILLLLALSTVQAASEHIANWVGGAAESPYFNNAGVFSDGSAAFPPTPIFPIFVPHFRLYKAVSFYMCVLP